MKQNDRNLTLQHFKRYPQLVWVLMSVHMHVIKLKYDFPVVICGDEGNGKSMFLLHFVELWYRCVLKVSDWSGLYIRYVQNVRMDWIKNFKDINEGDINANDEGADGLESKESISKFGKLIQRLYKVFRKKLFITPILIPDFFDLPLYFRKRVRAVIWVNKRGQFKFYSKNGIRWLNALNQNNKYKTMEVARPLFTGTFPDYRGELREPYDKMSSESPDKILDELIGEAKQEMSSVELYRDDVLLDIKMGKKWKDICEERGISGSTLTSIRKVLKHDGSI